VGEHVRLARAFLRATAAPDGAVDLGSGAGLPGLVLADAWPESRWTLVDRSARRAAFLRRAVLTLGWEDRVQVEQRAAEEAGRLPGLRGTQALVVSRGFGPPPVAAECGAPFLRVGGKLLVAEPPAGSGRWPAAPLAVLGLRPGALVAAEARIQVLDMVAPCPEDYPRRAGVPARHPLWDVPRETSQTGS
jgi:16S rRNA (guanine527-N7)-methyltransferase